MFQLSLLLLEPVPSMGKAGTSPSPHSLCAARDKCPIAWFRRDGKGCQCRDLWLPRATAELFLFLLPRANPCSPLLCAQLILLVVNLLPSHPWASSLAPTAQTFRHTGTRCCKGDKAQGMGHHVGTWISPSHGWTCAPCW